MDLLKTISSLKGSLEVLAKIAGWMVAHPEITLIAVGAITIGLLFSALKGWLWFLKPLVNLMGLLGRAMVATLVAVWPYVRKIVKRFPVPTIILVIWLALRGSWLLDFWGNHSSFERWFTLWWPVFPIAIWAGWKLSPYARKAWRKARPHVQQAQRTARTWQQRRAG